MSIRESWSVSLLRMSQESKSNQHETRIQLLFGAPRGMNTKGSGKRFGRITLVAAAEFLEGHVQASFNQMAVRLELESEIPEDTGVSVQKKCAQLARIVANEPDREIDTLEARKTLADAVIHEALALAEYGSCNRAQMVLEQSLA